MKIIIESEDDSDDDCKRDTYFTVVDGRRYVLAPCALRTQYTRLEIIATAKKFFGANVELAWEC